MDQCSDEVRRSTMTRRPLIQWVAELTVLSPFRRACVDEWRESPTMVVPGRGA